MISPTLGNREKEKTAQRATHAIPEKRARNNAKSSAYNKATADALQAERAADFEAKGIGVTTEFGLGDVPRSDELNERVHDIMHSSAGVFQFEFACGDI